MKDQFVITLLLFGGSMKRNSPLSLFPLSLDSYRSAAKITLTHFGAVAATRQLHRNKTHPQTTGDTVGLIAGIEIDQRQLELLPSTL